MTDQQISALINTLRLTNRITHLQKDILDTWDTLHKDPFDEESAHQQIFSNNINHPDIFTAICLMPGVSQKTADALTKDDMIFTLRHQFDGLISKEIGECINGKKEQ